MRIRRSAIVAMGVLAMAFPAGAMAAETLWVHRDMIHNEGDDRGWYGGVTHIKIFHSGVNRTVKATFDHQNPAHGNPSYTGLVNPFVPSNPNPGYNTNTICFNTSAVTQNMACYYGT